MDNGRVPNDPSPRDDDVIDPIPVIPASPALNNDSDTVAIPRPANELDDGEALEEPDDDPEKAG